MEYLTIINLFFEICIFKASLSIKYNNIIKWYVRVLFLYNTFTYSLFYIFITKIKLIYKFADELMIYFDLFFNKSSLKLFVKESIYIVLNLLLQSYSRNFFK